MSRYQHILAAVELDEHAEQLLKRAQTLAQDQGARLSVVHVVEYITLNTGEALIATPVDMTQEMINAAEVQLQKLCSKLGIPAESARVLIGPITNQILDAAKETGADLIAVGHQPRRGFLSNFFSHTDESVVSNAPCDVLALRLTPTR